MIIKQRGEVRESAGKKGNNAVSLGLGIASLSLCVISVIIGYTWFVGGIWFEIVAVALGIASLCTGRKWRGFAIGGILVSVLLIAVQIAFVILVYIAYQKEMEEINQRWEERQEEIDQRWEEHQEKLNQILGYELDNLGR